MKEKIKKFCTKINSSVYLRLHPGFFIDTAQTPYEVKNMARLVKLTKNIPGDLVEVGVYYGGSATVINHFKGKEKKLFLFDSFASYKEAGQFLTQEAWQYDVDVWKTQRSHVFEYVKKRFENDNVIVTKGFFPENIPTEFENKKISFAHIDVDIYEPTKSSLKYLYPKVNRGGIILFHDYFDNLGASAKQAIDEFLADKPEKPISLGTSQAFIVKQ